MGPSAKDLLAIVEAAYRLDLGDQEWLEGVASSCRPALDQGFGLSMFEFQYRTGSQPRILQAKRVGMPEELERSYPAAFAAMDPDVQLRPFRQGPCTTVSQMLGSKFKENELVVQFAQKFGIQDSLWITAAEPSGWGCGLHAGSPRVGWSSRSAIHSWARVAAHLSAAVRLRRRKSGDGGPHSGGDEAVFSPNGDVHHAEGEASASDTLARLRRAVLDVEAARSARREADAAQCLKAWSGLIEGRWSLLEHFETAGKRYIVARENAPSPPEVDTLTLRERQVLGYAALGHENKVIAYDLGIAHATVRVLMARAASKLRARSRSELISMYRVSCKA